MKICSKCGNTVEENTAFCSMCGTKFEDDSQISTPVEVQAAPEVQSVEAETVVPQENPIDSGNVLQEMAPPPPPSQNYYQNQPQGQYQQQSPYQPQGQNQQPNQYPPQNQYQPQNYNTPPAYNYQPPQAQSEDSGSIGWGVLGFFVPLAGLIIFLMWKNEKPKSAKVAGIGAIIGAVLGCCAYIPLMTSFTSSMQ